jgi:hypothetical protein
MNGCVRMEKNIEVILKKIERYTPQGEDWYELEDILEELYASEKPELGLESMISIFEKYPNEDNDILWGMLHGIEDIANYEMKVIESVKRKPSFFGVLMINRMLNAGTYCIKNIDLINILRLSTVNPAATDYVKEQAERFLERHSDKKER